MNQLQEQIEQFRKMASEDPDNELGHFRLGQLYQKAGDHENAIQSFRRTLELSPQFSKVYQLLGDSLLQLSRRDEAIETLKNGFRIADERGDRMPKDEMSRMLKELGEAPPEQAATVRDDVVYTGFRCQRPMCNANQRAVQLASPPFADDLGQRIFASICAECWHEWFRNYSIKVINELRIDLSTEYGQEEYDRHMRGFLGFEEEASATSH